MRKLYGWFIMISAAVCLFSTAERASASGFIINTQGATALAQGNSVIAHTSEPSTVFFNPALMNKLDGTQIQVGTTLLLPANKFYSSSTDASAEMDRDFFLPSTLFVTHKFSNELSAGLGIFSNYGLSSDWGDTWEGRYITTKSELKTYIINPVISYRPLPWFTVAAGLGFIIADAELSRMLNLSLFGVPDVKQTLKGDDTAFGFNLAAHIAFSDDLSLGMTYRSRFSTTLEGDMSHSFHPLTPAPIVSLFPNTTGRTDLDLPAQASIGLAYTGIKGLTIEVGGRWEGWSSFENLTIELDRPVAGNTSAVLPRSWKDAYSFNVGGRYQVTDAFAVMAGYIHQGNPVPDETFEPSVPDNRTNVYTVGFDMKYKGLTLGLAYDYLKVKTRKKNNAIDDNPFDGTVNPLTSANGDYKSHINIVALSLTYRF